MPGPAPPALLDLETPCLLLERERLQRNIDRFEARARQLGVGLRPHLKTAKSTEVARLIPSVAAVGGTVSTLREAEHFAAAGVTGLLYAVCLAPRKARRAVNLARRAGHLKVALDDPEALAALVAAAHADAPAAPRGPVDVLIEVDCGQGRSGVTPASAALLDLAGRIHAAVGLRLAGVFTHAGHAYQATSMAEVLPVARAERDAVLLAAERLGAHGLPCPIRSVGSTPTFVAVDHLEGVTEARPGVYVFGDLFQAHLGTCALEDLALSVLTTVIGSKPAANRLLVDAGALALSKDRSTAGLPGRDRGYGLVCDASGAVLPGVSVVSVCQEHGFVDLPPQLSAASFPVGSRLRVLPNHACMTAAAYERYHVLERGRLAAVWERVNGWGRLSLG